MMQVKAILTPFGKAYGYDIQVLNAQATVRDYLQALDAWQNQYLADCLGCTACCFERIPLTELDWQNCQTSVPEGLAAFIAQYAAVSCQDGAVDITLKRADNGACGFLDLAKGCCSQHRLRPLVCRTHVCLPKSQRAEALRAAIVNCGEDYLVWQYLSLKPGLAAALSDYAGTAFALGLGLDTKLSAIAEPELWQELLV